MSLLKIRPLGPARLATTPMLNLDVFSTQRAIGVPPPSTILGMLGALRGIVLDGAEVERDPLLGIGVLVEHLAKDLQDEALIEGPIFWVQRSPDDAALAVPLSMKGRLLLVKLEDRVLRSLYAKHAIPEDAVLGQAVPKLEIGIALRDSVEEPYNKTVAPGYTFRRALVHYADRSGRALDVTFLYKLNVKTDAADTLIRLGGEGRLAHLVITNEIDEKLAHLLRRVKSPLNASPGVYLVLNYWPLIPRSANALYLEKDDFVGLELFEDPSEDIIGVPQRERPDGGFPGPPKKYVIRLGLGFSEVVKRRRPQILALPPGTLVRLRHSFREVRGRVPDIYVKLLKAGYASLLELDSSD